MRTDANDRAGCEDGKGKSRKCCPGDKSKHDEAEWNWVYLTTVGNDIEFEIVAGLLQMANIPAVRKVRGVDRFVGVQIGGIEVMVPADRYEEAVQLMNAEVDRDNLDIDMGNEN